MKDDLVKRKKACVCESLCRSLFFVEARISLRLHLKSHESNEEAIGLKMKCLGHKALLERGAHFKRVKRSI